MDRLTMTSDKGGLAFTFDLDVTCKRREMDKIVALGERLKAYEDAEEQGLLVRLACKVGDTVYSVIYDSIREKSYGENPYYVAEDVVLDVGIKYLYFAGYTEEVSEIGKTIFLTREEAEEAVRHEPNN